MIDQARALLATLATDPTGPSSGPKWKSLHTLLKKAPCDQMRLARFIAERNVEAMRKVLDEVAAAPPPAPRQPAYAPSADGTPPPPRPSPPPLVQVRAEKPTPQQLKTALAAFKKRLKLTKLEQESRLGRSPLTSGAKSNIIAILPPNPNLYPKIYWEELEKQGQIRNTGGGFYELVDKPKPLRGAAAAAVAKAEGGGEAVEGDETVEDDVDTGAEGSGVENSSEESAPSA